MNQLTLLKSIVSDISGLLESEEFLNAHRFPNRFVRKRKLSMHQIILFLLHSTDKTGNASEHLPDHGSGKCCISGCLKTGCFQSTLGHKSFLIQGTL